MTPKQGGSHQADTWHIHKITEKTQCSGRDAWDEYFSRSRIKYPDPPCHRHRGHLIWLPWRWTTHSDSHHLVPSTGSCHTVIEKPLAVHWNGQDISWKALNEDIGVEELFAGLRSKESQPYFKKNDWRNEPPPFRTIILMSGKPPLPSLSFPRK